ncbi:hypothetical protein CDO52_15260 [Nocardiopsis gilva YIM 90087]|uniref:Manganese transport regulator n=2 Tax=Nocardiopsis gilva TaxID=280236 RepID=A0A223S770_9ACTN|nr:hypothetical protein CDO52_15260 [Nocardiopsis gilva YIM 90087]
MDKRPGTVESFDADTGFGYIIPDGDLPSLRFDSSCVSRGLEAIAEGRRVAFDLQVGSRGQSAVNVVPLWQRAHRDLHRSGRAVPERPGVLGVRRDRAGSRAARGDHGEPGLLPVRDTVATMGNASDRPSTSVEDYVKVIYDLQERGSGPVTISGMAERLSVSNSSVSGMLRKLSELGLVDHQRYGHVRLTDTGTKAALAVLRRHRLLETYLVEELGYSWDEVHDEAEELEHVVSDKFVDRIAEHLGNPLVDPHGDPIPTRDGQIVERDTHLLSQAEAGTIGVIVRVNDTDPDLLRYLADQRIGIGMRIEVVERQPFGGSLLIRIGAPGEQRDQALGLVAAEALWIAPEPENASGS